MRAFCCTSTPALDTRVWNRINKLYRVLRICLLTLTAYDSLRYIGYRYAYNVVAGSGPCFRKARLDPRLPDESLALHLECFHLVAEIHICFPPKMEPWMLAALKQPQPMEGQSGRQMRERHHVPECDFHPAREHDDLSLNGGQPGRVQK